MSAQLAFSMRCNTRFMQLRAECTKEVTMDATLNKYGLETSFVFYEYIQGSRTGEQPGGWKRWEGWREGSFVIMGLSQWGTLREGYLDDYCCAGACIAHCCEVTFRDNYIYFYFSVVRLGCVQIFLLWSRRDFFAYYGLLMCPFPQVILPLNFFFWPFFGIFLGDGEASSGSDFAVVDEETSWWSDFDAVVPVAGFSVVVAVVVLAGVLTAADSVRGGANSVVFFSGCLGPSFFLLVLIVPRFQRVDGFFCVIVDIVCDVGTDGGNVLADFWRQHLAKCPTWLQDQQWPSPLYYRHHLLVFISDDIRYDLKTLSIQAYTE